MSRSRRFDTDALVSALSDARDNTADQAREFYRSAAESLNDGSKTARKRMHHAVDALAGRPSPARWGQMAMFAAFGVIAGAVAALAARRVVAQRMIELEDKPDEVTALEQARMESTMVP
jgi:hypothetical protein